MKIFGIGISKTGFHSLTQAMEDLGYKAKRYPESYEDIETYDFLCDSFIFTRYKELDKKYPGSKFILTTREEESWLNSIVTHLVRKPIEELSEYRQEMRVEAWGSIFPSREDLRQAYRDHYTGVEDYFRGRDKDILVMEIVSGDGWDKLCPFLGKSELDKPFPKLNVTPK